MSYYKSTTKVLHTFLAGRKIWALQQSTKFVFYPSIWTIYNGFSSEYQQDFSLMLTLYGIIFLYYFYILCSHFSKMILTTEEVITAL